MGDGSLLRSRPPRSLLTGAAAPSAGRCMTLDPAVVLGAITALTGALGAVARMVYQDLRRDRDWWRDMALALSKNNERAIEVASKVARDA